MWFDVGIKRYTTGANATVIGQQLWFDVGIKRYTTTADGLKKRYKLWFDVGIKRYTTELCEAAFPTGCGLM